MNRALDYFSVASTPRYRAARRPRVRAAARQGMIVAFGAAGPGLHLACPVPSHAAGLILALNVTVMIVAAAGFLMLGTVARPPMRIQRQPRGGSGPGHRSAVDGSRLASRSAARG